MDIQPLPTELPVVRLRPRAHSRVRYGHPWVYSNEIEMDAAARALPPGVLVRLVSAEGRPLGTAIFNRLPLISARLLTDNATAAIDVDFIAERLRRALEIRERLIEGPYYRLIHAEADGLPGVIIDRFDRVLVLQINTAGMERLLDDLLEALERVLAPDVVVLRNDSTARSMEGLDSYLKLAKGELEGPIEVLENGARYLADVREGQKTGWYYDQRDNRAWVAQLARGGRVLDAYCYTGGFAIQAALNEAQEVTGLDRSAPALELAERAAQLNGVAQTCRFVKGEVFPSLQSLATQGERYGLVILDPPAFVKSRKGLVQGVKGYRKLARLAAQLVAPKGYLFAASCSHHVDPPRFTEQIRRGLADSGRSGRIIFSAGAAADHPVHPALPETAYLKALVVALD